MKHLYSFFPYFGGKRCMAPHYPRPLHNTIIEPFAGAAGYSCHYPHKNIMLFDADPIISAIWDYLIHVTEREFMSLPTEFEHTDSLDVTPAAKDLIGFWCQRGSTVPGRKVSSWARNDKYSNNAWGDRVKSRIAGQLQFIRHWTIQRQTYEALDNHVGTWFIDPPYQSGRQRYRYSMIDYDQLRDFCMSRLGQAIVCEKDAADWLPFKPFRRSRNLSGRHHHEAIWSRASSNWIWVQEAETLLASLAQSCKTIPLATMEQTQCIS